MIGLKFERLVVISEAGKTKDGHKKWLCKCDCGKTTIVDGRDLRRGKTKSCGCLLRETAKTQKHCYKHGDKHTRLYTIWNNMRDRCRRPKNSNYFNYGGRGIYVCKEWNDYITFKKWALDNGYKDNLSIDRIDVNGNYEPSNCRWATIQEQANNKRTSRKITHNGETHTITEWNKIKGYKRGLIADRIAKGWSIKRAIEEQPFVGKNQHFCIKDIDLKGVEGI